MSKANESQDFIKWFKATSKNDGRVLRIFDRKTYYTVYGEAQCQYIADTFYRTRKCILSIGAKDKNKDNNRNKNKTNNNAVVSCIHIRSIQIKSIIYDYVVRQRKTVEIYEKNELNNQWTLKQGENGRITPSNFSSDSLGEAAFNLCAVILCFNKGIKSVAVALINHSLFKMEIAHFIEDQRYTKMASLIVAKGIKQCILKCKSGKSHQAEMDKFKEMLQKSNVQVMEEQDAKFWSFFNSDSAQSSAVDNILNKASSKKLLTFNSNHQLSLLALTAIIKHEELEKDNSNWHRYQLSQHQMGSFMRLDDASLSALNLFPTISDNLSSANGRDQNHANNSLYGILKKCRSSMGDRLLSVWIRQPLVDINQIYRRQKLVKLFVENDEKRGKMRDDHLKSLVDLEKIMTKLQRQSKSKSKSKSILKDLVDLYNFAVELPFVKETLLSVDHVEFDVNIMDQDEDEDEDDDIKMNNNDNDNAHDMNMTPLDVLRKDFIEPIEEMAEQFYGFCGMIELVVDLDAVAKREYFIKPSFDNKLDRLSKKMKTIKQEMEQFRVDLASTLKTEEKSVKFDDHKSYGFCCKVNKNRKKGTNINQTMIKKAGFQILSTVKSAFLITDNDKLKTADREYKELKRRYAERSREIEQKAVDITKTYIPVINRAITVFAELDVLLSLAHIASCSPSPYVLPKILPNHRDGSNKKIIMKNAKHPILEWVQYENDGVVPNDVEMIDHKSSFQIVTGPNMGGKSTYIRMIGLIVLMAQIGSYVPCEECTITVVDSILSRIGGGDNQLRGVSTFMAEMLESSSILEAATKNSLIIIDELGRGTSTYDGYGIAYAISQHIITKIQSFTLFATHFHELADLSNTLDSVVNKHVTAQFDENEDLLTMLYKINEGPCPQSFGIEVAKLAKFPNNVIKDAQKKVNELENMEQGSISLKTHHSIQTILHLYEEIKGKVNENETKCTKDSQEYQALIQTLQEKIEEELQDNDELNRLALSIDEERDQQHNHNKMQID